MNWVDLHLFVLEYPVWEPLFFFNLLVSFMIIGLFTLFTASGVNLGKLYFPIDISSWLNSTPYST